jgi:hypothetical protein
MKNFYHCHPERILFLLKLADEKWRHSFLYKVLPLPRRICPS